MQSLKKSAFIALCILFAAAFSACDREEPPEIDYSEFSEVDIDDLLSEISAEKPNDTQWDNTEESVSDSTIKKQNLLKI